VVLKLTGVEPALTPPVVETMGAAPGGAPASAVLRAVLKDTGGAPSVDVAFQYRRKKRTEELYEKGEAWRETPLVARSSPGEFTARVDELKETDEYEFRAMVRHPLVTVFGEDKAIPHR
jgi:alpha-L-fucosidase